ncbi:MAG TPA: PKD domain-containing protein [Thermoplasmata archaeon]|jgi:PKD repeat protein|nr:PKD domain-containing protein [Thermoplasmata archaeon]
MTPSVTPQGLPLLVHAAPLPSPAAVNDVAVTAAQVDRRTTVVGTFVNVTGTIQNQGDSAQTVQVNASAGSRSLGPKSVTLQVNESKSVWFIWDTSADPPGTYPITVWAAPLPGETDLADNNRSAGSVTLLAPGTLKVQASADTLATDVGFSIRFTCKPSGGVSPYQYRWNFGDGRSGENDTETKAYSSPGEKTVTCAVTDNATAQASDSLTVVIAPIPVVLATVDRASAGPNTVLTFKAVAVGGTREITYRWSFGDGKTGLGTPFLHSYDKTGLFTVTLTATDSVGGHDDTSLFVSIAALTVTVMPYATTVKPGELVIFTAFASGGSGGPYAFVWKFGDGAVGTEASMSHSYASEGDYTPSLTVSDGTGAHSELILQRITVRSPGASASNTPPYFEVGLGVVAVIAASVGTVTGVRRRQRRRRWGPRPR